VTTSWDPALRIGVKAFKRTGPAMNDRGLRPSAGGHVSKLCGDVSAADKDNVLRQGLELQKLLARGEVFLAGNVQGLWTGARREHDVAGRERLITDLNGRSVEEFRDPMESSNAGLPKAPPPDLRGPGP
jgi:hypothetical protein